MRASSVTGLFVAVLVTLLLSSACSDPLAFTVINDTDETLTVWAFEEPCGTGPRYRGDYKAEGVVAPHETYDYYELWGGGSEVECIQAVDESRALVFEAPYDDVTTYRVSHISVRGEVIPDLQSLPKQSWLSQRREGFEEHTFVTTFLTVSGLLVYGAIAIGLFFAARAIYRRYFRRPRSANP